MALRELDDDDDYDKRMLVVLVVLPKKHKNNYRFKIPFITNFQKNTSKTDKPYTLVGPTVTRPAQDPLAVKLLDNRLYISCLI